MDGRSVRRGAADDPEGEGNVHPSGLGGLDREGNMHSAALDGLGDKCNVHDPGWLSGRRTMCTLLL